MSSATKRTILRVIHLVLSIPVLGMIYQSPAETQQYADGVRYIFAPILIFSGYCMYAGAWFAIIGVATLLGAYRLSGYGAVIISQVVLFIARKIFLVIRARRATS